MPKYLRKEEKEKNKGKDEKKTNSPEEFYICL
jgi:hypothetical protein